LRGRGEKAVSGDDPKSGLVRSGVRVLVVSPEAAARLLLIQMVERSNRRAAAAATGADAIDALATGRATVLLVDASTPELDEVLDAANARAVPVILMAAPGLVAPHAAVVLAKPVRQAALAAAIARVVDAVPSRRVLLVDDDTVSRELAAERLARRGWDVVATASGAEAWARWRAERFDLMLLDVLLPDMSGIDLAAHIRAHEHVAGLERVPIVALTGRASAIDQERCTAAGMDGHLAKPLAGEALAAVLDGVGHGGSGGVAPAADGLDAARILAQVHGDMAFLRRLIAIFREQSADLLRAGWRAIERDDAGGLDGAAHALRSVVGHFSTGAAFELAGAVESMARAANVAGASAPWRELESMVGRLRHALDVLDADATHGEETP
jgi:CheY-like chemotaxis protein